MGLLGSPSPLLFLLLSSSFFAGCLSQTPPHVIPLSVNSDMRYQIDVDMSSTNPQKLALELSTGTGYTVVAGTGCQGCDVAATYDQAQSQSASNLPGSGDVSIAEGTANGRLVKENCTLYTKAGKWAYNNQTILVANQSSSLFSKSASGIFGLGRNQGAGDDFSATIYSPWLSANSSRSAFTFGMNLQSPYDSNSNKNGGELHWLGIDGKAFNGNLSDVSITQSNLSDWTVTADGWSFQANNQAGSTTRGSLLAVVDPIESDIFVPKTMSRFIYAAVPGSQQSTDSTLGERWSLPCDSKMSFSLIILGKEYKLTEKNLVRKEGDTCLGVLQGWKDDGLSHFLLGSSFISTVYLVFTVNKDGQGKLSFGERIPPDSSSGLSGGAIAGIVIGSLAVVALLGALLYWFLRRRVKKNDEKEALQTTPDPYLQPSPESRGLLASQPSTASPFTSTFNHAEIASSSGHSNRASTAPGTVMMYADDETGQQRLFMYPVVQNGNEPPPMYRDNRDHAAAVEGSAEEAPAQVQPLRDSKGRKV